MQTEARGRASLWGERPWKEAPLTSRAPNLKCTWGVGWPHTRISVYMWIIYVGTPLPLHTSQNAQENLGQNVNEVNISKHLPEVLPTTTASYYRSLIFLGTFFSLG